MKLPVWKTPVNCVNAEPDPEGRANGIRCAAGFCGGIVSQGICANHCPPDLRKPIDIDKPGLLLPAPARSTPSHGLRIVEEQGAVDRARTSLYHRLWEKIHTRPFLVPKLDLKTEMAFLASIRDELPGGCGCRTDFESIIALIPPDLSSIESYFAWGWRLHRTISTTKFQPPKPVPTLEDAMRFWRQKALEQP